MAQAGYTPISLYYSTTSTQEPAAADLVSGELAINIADGKLFYKNSGGNVRLLSIGYGSSTVTPTNGGVQYGTGTALALTAAGSSGQILRSNGAAAPTWADLSTLGVNTISFGTTGLTPNSATAGAVTVAGTLVTANGGTGLGGATPFTANGVLYASSASALTSGSALTFDGTNLSTSGSFISSVAPASGSIKKDATNSYLSITGGTSPNSNGATILLSGSTYVAANTAFVDAAESVFRSLNGASEYMRLTSTGLGIGTSSPATKLEVAVATGSATQSRQFFQASGAGAAACFMRLTNTGADGVFGIADSGGTAIVSGGLAYATQLYTVGATALQFGTNSTIRATLDSSGNLGLGVTPSAWSGYGGVIELKGVGFVGSATTNMQIGANFYYNGTNLIYKTNGYATVYRQNAGAHDWLTAPSGTAGNAISFSQVMTLDASGNLGVGTTSPNNNLQVKTGSDAGGITIQRDSTVADTYGQLSFLLTTGDTGSPTAWIRGIRGSSVGVSSLTFGTSSTEQLRIDTSGNVLITGAGGLGYGTGSGGAVTQATSRTTGVTLNKTNGAITLVSAAGSNTFQTFTVTNSTVAATDTIIVNQKSGTDLYQIFVTNVAAGSFKISFATTGGTTTEQPVFNFAVIKAVTA